MSDELVIDTEKPSISAEAQQPTSEQQQQQQQQQQPGTHVMPLLYIQPNKITTSQPSDNQSLLSNNQPQLAAIINPINNPIVTGQNKVFIQSSSPVIPQTKSPHIVIKQPIPSVSTAQSQNQTQKHLLLRKTNSTSAQIVPLNTSPPVSQSGKHPFAYLGCTLIRPNKPRESVVIPAGSLPTTPLQKPKLVIAPMLPGPGVPSTSSVPVTTSQTMTNLILPVTVSPSAGPSNQSTLNVQITDDHNDNDSKETVSVVRESKSSNPPINNPPPLHPITKMSLLNLKNNSTISPESIKITENPDSAVITPIPAKKNKSPSPPQKRMKTMSNILRGSADKRSKKQTFSKINNLGSPRSVSSNPDEQHSNRSSVDEQATIIGLSDNEDNTTSETNDLDSKTMMRIVNVNNDETINNVDTEELKASAMRALDLTDSIGTMPSSSLKYRLNDFNIMETVDYRENSNVDKENVYLEQNSKTNGGVEARVTEEKPNKQDIDSDTFVYCHICGVHGLLSEFDSPRACSLRCSNALNQEKKIALKREKDAKDLRAKRRRKRELEKDEDDNNKDDKKKLKIKVKKELIDEQDDGTDSRDNSSGTSEKNSLIDEPKSKYDWLDESGKFSWTKYTGGNKEKNAPVRLFPEGYPSGRHIFKIGMKLEAVDRANSGHFCVMTIRDINGYRLRLNFDGYPESYDTWYNADSKDIFPPGWAEKNGHKLTPPKDYVGKNFNWSVYLKKCRATPAPKAAFLHISSQSAVCPPTGFRVGMKLEALDRKQSGMMCVATVADMMDSRILVHFDSWDGIYDYWADMTSPYIHPVGWSRHNGHGLMPPNGYSEKTFTWEAYLRETQSVAAPARAFKQRTACGFKRGMLLEAVDIRIPQLIRPAIVVDVKEYMIKLNFIGWPDYYDLWYDDDSSDIHPIGWCKKAGHSLESALGPEDFDEIPECGTPGCRGIGHIKGAKFATHNSPSGCPYSPQNRHKIKINTNRLNNTHDLYGYDDESLEGLAAKSSNHTRLTDRRGDNANYNFELEEDDHERESDSSRRSRSDANSDEEVRVPIKKRKRKRRQVAEERAASHASSNAGESTNESNSAPNELSLSLYQQVLHDIFDPGYKPIPDEPQYWTQHCTPLKDIVAKLTTNPRRWSNEETIKFIESLPNCQQLGNVFRKHAIDGEAFLMLTQDDLVTLLGLKFGPAIKVYNSILLLRKRVS